MTQYNYSSYLANECGSNDLRQVRILLKDHKNLDLTYGFPSSTSFTSTIRNACDIKQAPEYRETALKILQALLDYYKEQNLSGDSKSESYENALHKLCDILVDAHKSYPFTDIVKDIVVKYFKGLVSRDITYDMKEVINSIDEDDGEQSERDENFDDYAYGSLDTLDNISTDDYVLQDNEFSQSADIEWPEHLLHFRHLGGVAPDHTTEE
jgi:hypothetical protein